MKFQLKPDNRNSSEEELLEDLRAVSKKLKTDTVKMRDYDSNGRFHSSTISNRFGGWNEALKKADLVIGICTSVLDEELRADLKKVADEIAPIKLNQKIYNEKGKFSSGTITSRIGWNKTLLELGIKVSHRVDITELELFENLEIVWTKTGKQPGKRDMVKPQSQFSEGPYLNKYGSWRKALEAFIDYVDSDKIEFTPLVSLDYEHLENSAGSKNFKHKTKRDVSNRMKVQVLMRDGNQCKLCGVTVTGENIHFDHIKPWSKGGETVIDNLQVLCAKCNLAKGDYYDETQE